MRITRSIARPAPAAAASARARASAVARFSASRSSMLALLQVEAHVVHRRRAPRHREVDDLADARDVVEPHLDRIPRDVAARDLPSVDPVGLELQIVGQRADRVLWNAGRDDLLLHRGHRRGVRRLRFLRHFRSRLRADRHERLVGRSLDDPFARSRRRPARSVSASGPTRAAPAPRRAHATSTPAHEHIGRLVIMSPSMQREAACRSWTVREGNRRVFESAGSSSPRLLPRVPRETRRRRYTARRETRTVRHGAHAVHVGEPRGLQPVGERRAPADAARAARRRRGSTPCSTSRSSTRSRTARSALRSLVAAQFPGADASTHPGHQRRLRGQLPRGVADSSSPATKSRCWCRTTCRRGAWCARSAARSRSGGSIEDRAAGRWRPDLDELARVVSDRTRLIIICTPNNPTGARLTSDELDAHRGDRGPARQLGAVRRGLSRRRARRHRDAVDVGTVGAGHRDQRAVESLWAARPAHRLGRRAARRSSRRRGRTTTTRRSRPARSAIAWRAWRSSRRVGRSCFERTRGILRANLPLIEDWLREHDPSFSWLRPEAGAILYARYQLPASTPRSS